MDNSNQSPYKSVGKGYNSSMDGNGLDVEPQTPIITNRYIPSVYTKNVSDIDISSMKRRVTISGGAILKHTIDKSRPQRLSKQEITLERQKKQALFGSRASGQIFKLQSQKKIKTIEKQNFSISNLFHSGSEDQEDQTWRQKIIISHTSKPKAIFDVVILIAVGYSCVTTIFIISFDVTKFGAFQQNFDNSVEVFFWADLILNFLQSYKDTETGMVIKDLKQIAHEYIFKGWFWVDFISVFPFELLFSTGSVTKLLRLARLPRMIKLIDISKFKKVAQSFQNTQSRDEKIVEQYIMLQIYRVFRLVIIAIIITYFLGCFWFLYCTTFHDQRDENGEPKNDFIKNFNLNVTFVVDENDPTNVITVPGLYDMNQLLIACYYVLTTLSTVGYGDYFPITNNERVLAIILMLGGVAFFSYIMGNFIEILSNYDKKMGGKDMSGDLTDWLLQLTRFNNNQPINKKMMEDIEDNFRYYWDKDRLACVKTDDMYLDPLPRKIKNQILTVYLFSDIFKEFKRFFSVGGCATESGFLYDCAFGFMPREFDPNNNEDKIIYDEEEEVIEMYFITEGLIGVGFSLISNGYLNKPYSIVKKLKGQIFNQTMICDHYVVNNLKSQFIYMALGDQNARAYALSRKHLMTNVFPKYPDIMENIQLETFKIYKKQIFKPINEARNKYLATMNKKQTYRNLQMTETQNSKSIDIKMKQQSKSKIQKLQKNVMDTNMDHLRDDLTSLTDKIGLMVTNCNSKIQTVIEQVDITTERTTCSHH